MTSDSFLQRWSKRKRAAQQLPTDSSETPPIIADTTKSPAQVTTTADTQEKPLTDADMPSLDSLTPQTDMQPFFSQGVSEELRREAFRALFKQAQFNQCDGMDIYARNYNDFKPLGDIIPHDMQRFFAREAQATAEAESAIPAPLPSETTTDTSTQPTIAPDEKSMK
ncbi:DUF3306 domain-containing protein [Thioflexithrix psekupsensis]|uniref:DUF3306 domain-containing protein n=1 Tax=Thioflexithrix psekupsensis TaxID=1570016 RepID=A0A251X8R9_9GAMM|nr:DUF3306 domain-containing protein [Thioflexithrix psekupsensis]OUD14459.1 hypothetical protein TPSD3_09140 [Thioflexithrix psekupsensis]